MSRCYSRLSEGAILFLAAQNLPGISRAFPQGAQFPLPFLLQVAAVVAIEEVKFVKTRQQTTVVMIIRMTPIVLKEWY